MSANSNLNIRDFIRAQRRERAAAKLMEKQKLESDRRRIMQALQKVRSEAKAARRSLHTKSSSGYGREGDRVDSHATESKCTASVVHKKQAQLPFSDITNNVDVCSIGNTSRSSCNETLATAPKSESIATQESLAMKKYMSDAVLKEDAATYDKDSNVTEGNLKLDTRREWELQPLQYALHRFSLADENFQKLTESHPLEYTIRRNIIRLKHEQGRKMSAILLNHGLSTTGVKQMVRSHSAISLYMHDHTSSDNSRPHSGRKHKEASDNYASVRAERKVNITKENFPSIPEYLRLENEVMSSENNLIDDITNNYNIYDNPAIVDYSEISSKVENDGLHTCQNYNEASVRAIGDSNAIKAGGPDGSNELTLECCKESVGSDDEYESSFLSED